MRDHLQVAQVVDRLGFLPISHFDIDQLEDDSELILREVDGQHAMIFKELSHFGVGQDLISLAELIKVCR